MSTIRGAKQISGNHKLSNGKTVKEMLKDVSEQIVASAIDVDNLDQDIEIDIRFDLIAKPAIAVTPEAEVWQFLIDFLTGNRRGAIPFRLFSSAFWELTTMNIVCLFLLSLVAIYYPLSFWVYLFVGLNSFQVGMVFMYLSANGLKNQLKGHPELDHISNRFMEFLKEK